METATVRRRDAEEGRASAGELTLERGADGKLWALRGDAERVVWVRRCFPWSEPGRFVSLRDEDDNELALVSDPAELDRASRRVLEEAMAAAGFVFEVTRGMAIEEEVEIRHWRGGEPPGAPPVFNRRRPAARALCPGGPAGPPRGGGAALPPPPDTPAPFPATSRSPLCNPALPHTLAGLLISKLSAFSPGGCHAETRRSAAGRPSRSSAGVHDTRARMPMSRR